MKNNKIVIFERITPALYPLLISYFKKKYSVFVFDFTWDLKNQRFLRKLINSNRLKRIFIKPNNSINGRAIDLAEIIYANLKQNGLLKRLRSLYISDQIALIVKKEMTKNLFRYLFINRYLSELSKKRQSVDRVLFIPEKYSTTEDIVKRFGNIEPKPIAPVRIPKKALWASRVLNQCLKLKYFAGSVYYALSFAAPVFLGRFFGKTKTPPVEFLYAVAIEGPSQVKFKGRRGFDFLLDNKVIRKDNTVFLLNVPMDECWIAEKEKNGFQFVRSAQLYSKKRMMHISFQPAFMRKALHTVLRSFAHLNAPDFILAAFFYGVYAFVHFHVRAQQVRFKNYIYSNNETTIQIAQNALFRNAGIRSWCYLAFWVGGYPRSKGVPFFKDHRNIIWSHLNPDYMVCINHDMIQYFRMHHQRVGEYLPFGSIYSEMIKEESFEEMRSLLLKENFDISAQTNQKICAFFDTSFVDEADSPATVSEGISFYEDIESLLKKRKDLLVIVKPSKNEKFYISPESQWYSMVKGKELIECWKRLQDNPNVFFAGDSGDIVRIMAGSDLIITHCMSSTTGEALGARKKAIWYESGERHRGLLYDQIPGLVVHGLTKLEKKIDELLYGSPKKAYNEYLDIQILGKVESNLDGKALTRFREALHVN